MKAKIAHNNKQMEVRKKKK